MKRIAFLICTLAMCTAAWGRPAPRPPQGEAAQVSFRYLESRRQEVRLGDRGTHTIWRVDASALAERSSWHDIGPPPATLRERDDLVSTDDIAWVALAYLKQGEMGRSAGRARDEAKKALKTLLALQRADGGFVAYQTPQAPGETVSVYSTSDWMATARAIEALGAGLRVFSQDGGLANALQGALEQSLQRVQASWTRIDQNVGRRLVIDQMRLPAWLPYHRADAASAIVLGYSDWYLARRSDTPLPVLRALADGLVEMQRGTATQYPWAAFLPQADKPSLWYADGNLQAAALLRAREALQKPTYAATALQEVDVLLPRLLAPYPSIWQMTPIPSVSPRIPGAAAALAINAAAAYRFSGKDRHAHLAALFASWLLTPENDHPPLYDPSSGRCTDALPARAHETASPGASARALYALLELSGTPATRWLPALTTDHDATPDILEATDGRPVTQAIPTQEVHPPGGPRTLARLTADSAFWLRFTVKRTSSYGIDVVYLKDRTSGATLQVRLDGDAILRLPLGTTDDEPQLNRLAAVPPSRLDPGLHTLGVKGNGLALSSGSLIDVFIVGPILPWRVWRLPDGHHAALFANLGSEAQTCVLPAALGLPARTRGTTLMGAGGDSPVTDQTTEAIRLPDGAWQIRLPAGCSSIVEW